MEEGGSGRVGEGGRGRWGEGETKRHEVKTPGIANCIRF